MTLITFSEKSSWSCPTCGSADIFAIVPLPTWNGTPPAIGIPTKSRVRRCKADFIRTSSEKYFAGDRTCIHNQWNAEFLWDKGNFALTGYSIVPWDTTLWMKKRFPGIAVEVPLGPYSFTPAQRTATKCYGRCSGDIHMSSAGSPIAVPFSSSRLDIYQCWRQGYAQHDVYLYRWIGVGSRTLCLVANYTLIIGIGSDLVQVATAQWGVCAYGKHSTYGVSSYSFNGTSFGRNATWIPASFNPRAVTKNDVVGWIASENADPFGYFGKAIGPSTLLGTDVTTGLTCSYTGAPADFSACEPALRLMENADVFDKTYVHLTPTEYEWADLCDTAVDNCRYIDINSIQYLRELVGYIRMIVTFITTKKVTLPKNVGSGWLSARYGMRLTMNDTKDLVTAIQRANSAQRRAFSVARSKARTYIQSSTANILTYSRDLTYKIYYNRRSDPALDVIRTAMDWDLWPTLQNDWDMIPFSFVVDWFADVEGIMEDLDNSIYEAYLSILSVLYTEKHVYVHDPVLFCTGSWKCVSCDHTFYHRRHSPVLHYAPLRLERGHSSNINIIDGVSLLIQRMK